MRPKTIGSFSRRNQPACNRTIKNEHPVKRKFKLLSCRYFIVLLRHSKHSPESSVPSIPLLLRSYLASGASGISTTPQSTPNLQWQSVSYHRRNWNNFLFLHRKHRVLAFSRGNSGCLSKNTRYTLNRRGGHSLVVRSNSEARAFMHGLSLFIGMGFCYISFT